MPFMVFSKGPVHPTSATLKMVADVESYVAELRSRGHMDIRVGLDAAGAVPFDEWVPLAPKPPRSKSKKAPVTP